MDRQSSLRIQQILAEAQPCGRERQVSYLLECIEAWDIRPLADYILNTEFDALHLDQLDDEQLSTFIERIIIITSVWPRADQYRSQ